MNKKTILLLVGVIIVSVLAYFSWKIVSNSGSSVESELIEFSIKNTDQIDRIVITDNFGRVMDLHRPEKSDNWVDKDGGCISQEGVSYILDACKKIEFKGYLTENSVKTYNKIMLSQHIKVDYYINGKWEKTWYIGPPSKDHLGQVMLLDSRELGKSTKPVIMTIKGMFGIIEPRFYADPLKWRCSQIYSLTPEKIKQVNVEFPLEPARSFSVERISRGRYSVKQQNIPLPSVDTQNVLLYLNKFKKVHFENPNYTLNGEQIDSLKKSSPFCILKVQTADGKTDRIRMFRIQSETPQVNEFGQPVNYEIDRFWAELNNGDIVKCQYFVFDPITFGHFYFPLDLSTLDLNDYVVKSPEHYRK